ncbi:hypothetical protein [Flavobacterium frigoris]|uniref:Lipoprotein n=1 Tax=Flavobacterium frigoris TaxID=229204 RepID=A0A1H9PRA5_FLAFI|nr:hypothetical protein [Flavobacterium frigoris]SER50761.1 hypothetical protein SAMN05444355_11421 [Flavobacterium frigoris]
MKKTTLSTITKNLFLGLLLILFTASLTSCSKKVAFQTSTIVPAARGDVKITKDNNKNYLIQIKLENLAEVKRLESSKKAYVVWMESDDSMVKNIGQIKSDSKFLSSKLKATFETVTPIKPTKIFITAEEDAEVQYPDKEIILSTRNL